MMFELSHHKNNTEIFAMRVYQKKPHLVIGDFFHSLSLSSNLQGKEYYSWVLN